MKEYTDKQLLEGYKKGNKVIENRLYDRIYKDVLRFIGKKFDNIPNIREDATMITTEAMLKLKKSKYKEIGKARAFIYHIFKHESFTFYRRNKDTRFEELSTIEPFVLEYYKKINAPKAYSDLKKHRKQFLFYLEEKSETTCGKHLELYYQGYSSKERATYFNTSVSYVDKVLSQCKRKFRAWHDLQKGVE